MDILTSVRQTSVRLVWDQEIPGPGVVRARQLRGALTRAFADDDRFHQHDPEGKPLYRYPQIHYRWIDGEGWIVGWGDTSRALLSAPWLDLEIALGRDEVRVADAMLETWRCPFGWDDHLRHYQFGSPGLFFNQKNYQRYQEMSELEQTRERDRLLVAQILTALRGLCIDFPRLLFAAFTHVSTVKCRYKKQDLLGLTGGFVCNAILPSGFALGHATSHGYGWIVAAEEIKNAE